MLRRAPYKEAPMKGHSPTMFLMKGSAMISIFPCSASFIRKPSAVIFLGENHASKRVSDP